MNATETTETLTGGDLAKLLVRAEACGWRDCLVTEAGVWSVGCTSGTGIDGVILRVSRIGGTGERCAACDGRRFPVGARADYSRAMDEVRAAADEVARAHGHVVLFSTTASGQSSMRDRIKRGR